MLSSSNLLVLISFGVFGSLLDLHANEERTNANKIALVLRYDDYRGQRPSVADELLFDLSKRYNLALTFAVIPFQPNGEPISSVCLAALAGPAQRSNFEVVLHGHSHENISHGNSKSEFLNRPRARQLQMLQTGRAVLETSLGFRIRTFSPPWNSYDAATVSCLDELGFETMSADWRGPGWPSSRLHSVPATCGLNDLKSAISHARALKDLTPHLIVCLFHDYDLREMDAQRGTFSNKTLDELLLWVSLQKDVETVTVSRAAIMFPYCQGDYQEAVCSTLKRNDVLPERLQLPDTYMGVYPGPEQLQRMRRFVFCRLAALDLSVCACFCGLGLVYLKLCRRLSRTLRVVNTVTIVALLAFVAFHAATSPALRVRSNLLYSMGFGVLLAGAWEWISTWKIRVPKVAIENGAGLSKSHLFSAKSNEPRF